MCKCNHRRSKATWNSRDGVAMDANEWTRSREAEPGWRLWMNGACSVGRKACDDAASPMCCVMLARDASHAKILLRPGGARPQQRNSCKDLRNAKRIYQGTVGFIARGVVADLVNEREMCFSLTMDEVRPTWPNYLSNIVIQLLTGI